VQPVSASQAKNLPGRPKTDKVDAIWLARLTELRLLRASFVPPKAIRDLRDCTRARARLVQERPVLAAAGKAVEQRGLTASSSDSR
jgi:hypothetical protein